MRCPSRCISNPRLGLTITFIPTENSGIRKSPLRVLGQAPQANTIPVNPVGLSGRRAASWFSSGDIVCSGRSIPPALRFSTGRISTNTCPVSGFSFIVCPVSASRLQPAQRSLYLQTQLHPQPCLLPVRTSRSLSVTFQALQFWHLAPLIE